MFEKTNNNSFFLPLNHENPRNKKQSRRISTKESDIITQILDSNSQIRRLVPEVILIVFYIIFIFMFFFFY